jgi:hypothetical protein
VDDANRLNLQLILTLAAVKNTDLPVDEILDHMDEAGDPHAAYNELIEYERDMLEIDDNMLESTEDDELPF